MKSQSSFSPRLVVIEGRDKGKVIPLKDGTVVVGRSKGDILIQDPRISRSHIALKFDEKKGTLEFTDLKSLNGTIINGSTKETGALKDGDKLQLGNTLFDCQITPAGEEATIKATVATRKKNIEETQLSDLISLESSIREPAALKEAKQDTGQVPLPPTEAPAAVVTGGRFTVVVQKFHALPKRTRNLAAGAALVIVLALLVGRNDGTNSNLGQEIKEVRSIATSGKIVEATTRAEALVTRNNTNPEALLLLGDLYLGAKLNEKAILTYRKVHDFEPPVPIAHLRIIRALMRSGLVEEASHELKHVDDVLKKEGPHSKELFLEAAQVFIEFKELKQPPEKVFILAKALQTTLAPESPIGFKLEAQVLFQTGRNEEAVQSLEKALHLDPKDEWSYENLAFAKLSGKDAVGATRVVDEWMVATPGSTKPMLVMAYLKFNEGKPQDAQPLLQRVIEVLARTPTNPHYAEALNLLGQIFIQQNQPDIASTYLKQACSLGFEQSCRSPVLSGTTLKTPGEVSVGTEFGKASPTPERAGASGGAVGTGAGVVTPESMKKEMSGAGAAGAATPVETPAVEALPTADAARGNSGAVDSPTSAGAGAAPATPENTAPSGSPSVKQ